MVIHGTMVVAGALVGLLVGEAVHSEHRVYVTEAIVRDHDHDHGEHRAFAGFSDSRRLEIATCSPIVRIPESSQLHGVTLIFSGTTSA